MLEVPKSFKGIAATVGHVKSKTEAQADAKVVKDNLQEGDYFICLILREPTKRAVEKLKTKAKDTAVKLKPAKSASKKK